MGDTTGSENVLSEAAGIYDYDPQVVMYLINIYVDRDSVRDALHVLDEAAKARPDEYRFPWSRGLIYEAEGEYGRALDAFGRALELSPDNPKICYHTGLVYYNRGVDLREQSMQIRNNEVYRRMKQQVSEQFAQAHHWLERSHELDPSDPEVGERLSQLEYQLRMGSSLDAPD